MAGTSSLSTLVLIILFGCSARAERAALVVVDMQPRFANLLGQMDRPDNRIKLDQVLSRQRELIRLAKANRMAIVLVEYKGFGETFASLIEEIGDYSNTRSIAKGRDGVFDSHGSSSRQIKRVLEGQGVRELLVVGANGDGCVAASIEGAIRNGFRVWTETRATINFEYEEFDYPYSHAETVRTLRRLGDQSLLKINETNALVHEHARIVARDETRAACEVAMGSRAAPAPSLWKRLLDGWHGVSPSLPQR